MKGEPGVFDFLNAINYDKKDFDEIYFSAYKPFTINRFLSYTEDTAILANEMNQYPDLDVKAQFLFLREIVRKRKRFSKWVKSVKDIKIEIIKKYYKYSDDKANEVVDLLSDKDIEEIERRMFVGGK